MSSPNTATTSSSSSSAKGGSRKINEMLKEWWSAQVTCENMTPPFAFEFYPPRTKDAVNKLYERLEVMSNAKPMYVDFTWGAGGSTSDLTLELAVEAKKRFGLEPNMHLTCTNMPADMIDKALEGAKAGGVRNIVALRGDPPKGKDDWEKCESGFSCALDLVKHIRAKYGDYFCISVAGYPEGHPTVIKPVEGGESGLKNLSASERARLVVIEEDGQSEKDSEKMSTTTKSYFVCSDADFKEELLYLKRKVDAGADLIITQMFFDPQVFLNFVKACRAIGIDVPIIPGIMLLQAYGGFCRMTKFCKSCVPSALMARLEAVKTESKKIKELGTAYGVEMSRALMEANACPVLHYYTLNLERVVMQILDKLNLCDLDAYNDKKKKMKESKRTAEESKGNDAKASQAQLESLRTSEMSETVENLAVKMEKNTILSQSLDEIRSTNNDATKAMASSSS